jgi:hypothetical protein
MCLRRNLPILGPLLRAWESVEDEYAPLPDVTSGREGGADLARWAELRRKRKR